MVAIEFIVVDDVGVGIARGVGRAARECTHSEKDKDF